MEAVLPVGGPPSASLPYHRRFTGRVAADRPAVYAYLDSHARLVRHMDTPNWRMGWGRMSTAVDAGDGRVVGSHLHVSGHVFGLALEVDEVVEVHDPPVRKVWATLGEPRLLVIGAYRMHVELEPASPPSGVGPETVLTVGIDYALPRRGIPRLLARALAAPYATWCTTQMVRDTCSAFAESPARDAPNGEV